MEKLKKFIVSKIESLVSDVIEIKRMNYSDDTKIHKAKISVLIDVLNEIYELENPVDLVAKLSDDSRSLKLFSDAEIRGCKEE